MNYVMIIDIPDFIMNEFLLILLLLLLWIIKCVINEIVLSAMIFF